MPEGAIEDPLVQRLLHAGLGCPFANARADPVVDPVGDHRPAVVRAGADHVHLVPALGAVLVGPQRTGRRVQRSALLIAVA